MRVTRVKIQNVRCFVDEDLQLSPGINVVVGPNNNGKTTLLNCISVLQRPRYVNGDYQRIGTENGSIRIWLDKFLTPELDRRINNYFSTVGTNRLQGC